MDRLNSEEVVLVLVAVMDYCDKMCRLARGSMAADHDRAYWQERARIAESVYEKVLDTPLAFDPTPTDEMDVDEIPQHVIGTPPVP